MIHINARTAVAIIPIIQWTMHRAVEGTPIRPDSSSPPLPSLKYVNKPSYSWGVRTSDIPMETLNLGWNRVLRTTQSDQHESAATCRALKAMTLCNTTKYDTLYRKGTNSMSWQGYDMHLCMRINACTCMWVLWPNHPCDGWKTTHGQCPWYSLKSRYLWRQETQRKV